jgi:pre-mRNA-processing factor 8
VFIKAEDPDLPAFYYDPVINPIAGYKSQNVNQFTFQQVSFPDVSIKPGTVCCVQM